MDCKSPFLLALPTSLPPPPAPPAPPKKNRKKTYMTLAAVIAIIVIVTAAVFVPQINADVISLGVHYKVGEKLTYDVTTAMSTESGESSTSYSTDSTVTIEVISFEGDTYKLNYTSITSIQGYSMSTSKIVNVKENEMVTALALLPVTLQGYVTSANGTEGLLTGFFDQSQAKVGDTWTIPLGTTGSSETTGEITVTFKSIQDITVPAGTYKVFRIDFSDVSSQNVTSTFAVNADLSGQAYLESGTCKQIKSELTMDLSNEVNYGSLSNYSVTYTFTSTLAKDEQP